MKISANFELEEFIYPEVFARYGVNSLWFLDYRLIAIAQYFRDNLGKSITINNWHTGGQYKESGLRDFATATGGSKSQHKYGKALDLKVAELTPAQVFDFIHMHWTELSALGMTTTEDIQYTPTWNHIDTRYWGDSKLHIVKP